jgi:mannose-1-phosphate guanylyltransferase
MRAMILAAGLGTRLRPLTFELPKPLVPVGDRPSVAHVARELARAGIDSAVLNTHHLADAFTPDMLARIPIPIQVVHEPAILGTGGGVANAAELLGDGDVVVWNADILTSLDLGAMIAAHRASGALATLAIAPRAEGEGTVGVDAAGRVARLRGKRFGDESQRGDFLGIYVLSGAFRQRLPSVGCLLGDGAMPLLDEGARIATFPAPVAWDEVGSVASYLAANASWLAREGRASFVHPSARVAAGVDVTGSVVGEGAVVEGEGALRDVVVWPSARAVAPLSRAVVTPRAVAAI